MSLLSDLVFSTQDGLVVFPQHLLLELEKYRQSTALLPESGGILLGSMRGKNIEITDYTIPQPDDTRSRYRFERCSLGHINKAVSVWNKSDGIVSYIGEWHSHPEVSVSPSSIDLAEWHRKLPRRPVFLVIIGIQTNWFGYWNGNIIEPIGDLNHRL